VCQLRLLPTQAVSPVSNLGRKEPKESIVPPPKGGVRPLVKPEYFLDGDTALRSLRPNLAPSVVDAWREIRTWSSSQCHGHETCCCANLS
jgi:hypothetical protein